VATKTKSKSKASAQKPAETKAPKTPTPDKKIELLAKENPKRKGTKAHKRFAAYRTGMTTSEAKEAGLTAVDLAHDSSHGYIKLT
jgi:hypothetical protein